MYIYVRILFLPNECSLDAAYFLASSIQIASFSHINKIYSILTSYCYYNSYKLASYLYRNV